MGIGKGFLVFLPKIHHFDTTGPPIGRDWQDSSKPLSKPHGKCRFWLKLHEKVSKLPLSQTSGLSVTFSGKTRKTVIFVVFPENSWKMTLFDIFLGKTWYLRNSEKPLFLTKNQRCLKSGQKPPFSSKTSVLAKWRNLPLFHGQFWQNRQFWQVDFGQSKSGGF